MITDRDICIAAATRSLDPARIQVSDAMTRADGGHGTGARSEDLLGALRVICAHTTAGAGARP